VRRRGKIFAKKRGEMRVSFTRIKNRNKKRFQDKMGVSFRGVGGEKQKRPEFYPGALFRLYPLIT
jgi:hypothetical protein